MSPVYCEPEDGNDDSDWKINASSNREFAKYGLNINDIQFIAWFLDIDIGYGVARRIIQCGPNRKRQVEFSAAAAFNRRYGFMPEVLDRKHPIFISLPTADSASKSGRSEDFKPKGYNSYFDRHGMCKDVEKCFIATINERTGKTEPFGFSVSDFTSDGSKVETCSFNNFEKSQEYNSMLMYNTLMRSVDNHLKNLHYKYNQHDVDDPRHVNTPLNYHESRKTYPHLGVEMGDIQETHISCVQRLLQIAAVTKPQRMFTIASKIEFDAALKIHVSQFSPFTNEKFVMNVTESQFFTGTTRLGVRVVPKDQLTEYIINEKSKGVYIHGLLPNRVTAQGDYIWQLPTVFYHSDSDHGDKYFFWLYQFKYHANQYLRHWILAKVSDKFKSPNTPFDERDLEILLISDPVNCKDPRNAFDSFDEDKKLLWYERIPIKSYTSSFTKFQYVPILKDHTWTKSKVEFDEIMDTSETAPTETRDDQPTEEETERVPTMFYPEFPNPHFPDDDDDDDDNKKPKLSPEEILAITNAKILLNKYVKHQLDNTLSNSIRRPYESELANDCFESMARYISNATSTWDDPGNSLVFEVIGDFVYVEGDCSVVISDEGLINDVQSVGIIKTNNDRKFSVLDQYEWNHNKMQATTFQGGYTLNHDNEIDSYLGSIWVCLLIRASNPDNFVFAGDNNRMKEKDYKLHQKIIREWYIPRFTSFSFFRSHVMNVLSDENFTTQFVEDEGGIKQIPNGLLKEEHKICAQEIVKMMQGETGYQFKDQHRYIIATVLNMDIHEFGYIDGLKTQKNLGFAIAKRITAKRLLNYTVNKNWIPESNLPQPFEDVFATPTRTWIGESENFRGNLVVAATNTSNPFIHARKFEISREYFTYLYDVLSQYTGLGLTRDAYDEIFKRPERAVNTIYENKAISKLPEGQVSVDWDTYRTIKLMRSVIGYHYEILSGVLKRDFDVIARDLSFLTKYHDDRNGDSFGKMHIREQWLVYLYFKKEKRIRQIAPAEFQLFVDEFHVRITVLEFTPADDFDIPKLKAVTSSFDDQSKDDTGVVVGTPYNMWSFYPECSYGDESALKDIVLLVKVNTYRLLKSLKIAIEDVRGIEVKKEHPSKLGTLRTCLSPIGFFNSVARNTDELFKFKNYVTDYLGDPKIPWSQKSTYYKLLYRDKVKDNVTFTRECEKLGKEFLHEIKSNPLWIPKEVQMKLLLLDLCKMPEPVPFVVVLGWNYVVSKNCTFAESLKLGTKWIIGEINESTPPIGLFYLYEDGQLRHMELNREEKIEYLTYFGIGKWAKARKDLVDPDPDPDQVRVPKPEGYDEPLKKSDWADEVDLTSSIEKMKPSDAHLGYSYSGPNVKEDPNFISMHPIQIDILKLDTYSNLGSTTIVNENTTVAFQSLLNRSLANSYRPLIRQNFITAETLKNFTSEVPFFKINTVGTKCNPTDKDALTCNQIVINTTTGKCENSKIYIKPYFHPSQCIVSMGTSIDGNTVMSLVDCLKSWFLGWIIDNAKYKYLDQTQKDVLDKYTTKPNEIKGGIDFDGCLHPDNINMKTICNLITLHRQFDKQVKSKGGLVNKISERILALMENAQKRWPKACGRNKFSEITATDKIIYKDKSQIVDEFFSDLILIGALFNVKFNLVTSTPKHDMDSLYEDRDSIPYIPLWEDFALRWPVNNGPKPIEISDVLKSSPDELAPFQIPIFVKDNGTVSYLVYEQLRDAMLDETRRMYLYKWIYTAKQIIKEQERNAAVEGSERSEKAKKEREKQQKEKAADERWAPAMRKTKPPPPSGDSSGGDSLFGNDSGPVGGGGGSNYVKNRDRGGGGSMVSGGGGGGGGGHEISGTAADECPHSDWGGGYAEDSDNDEDTAHRGGRRGKYEEPDEDGNGNPRRRKARSKFAPKNHYEETAGMGGNIGKYNTVVKNGEWFQIVGRGNAKANAIIDELIEKERDQALIHGSNTGFFYSKFNIGAPAFSHNTNYKHPNHVQYDPAELNLPPRSESAVSAQGRMKEIYMLTSAMGTMMMNAERLAENAWATSKYHIGQTEEARKMATIFSAFFKKAAPFPISKRYTSHILLAGKDFMASMASKHNLPGILRSCAGLNTRTLDKACRHIRDLEIIPKEEFDRRADAIDAASQKLFKDWYMHNLYTSMAYIQATFQGSVTSAKGFVDPVTASILNKCVFDKFDESSREKNKNSLIFIAGTPYGKQLRPLFDILFVHPKTLLGTGFRLGEGHELETDSDEDDEILN